MSPTFEPMKFEDLTQLFREEKKGGLVECRSDLYSAMTELLNKLRSDYENEITSNPDSEIAEGIRDLYKKAERHCKDIISNRTNKVLTMALRSAEGFDRDLKAMTPEERELYDSTVAIVKTHISTVDRKRGLKEKNTQIDSPIFDENADSKKTEDAVIEDESNKVPIEKEPVFEDESVFIKPNVDKKQIEKEEQAVVEPEPKEKIEEEGAKAKCMLIRILEDIPPIAGIKRDYYLAKEDIVTLPEDMAKALINSNKAVLVNPEL